jgi:hypothetical protein
MFLLDNKAGKIVYCFFLPKISHSVIHKTWGIVEETLGLSTISHVTFIEREEINKSRLNSGIFVPLSLKRLSFRR